MAVWGGFINSCEKKRSKKQRRKGKNKSELQGLTPLSWGRVCQMRRGGWGHASILSVMPNVAPDND